MFVFMYYLSLDVLYRLVPILVRLSVEKLGECSFKDTTKMNITDKANSNIRPKMTYAQLIAEALLDAEDQKLGSSEICHAIAKNHPYYNLEDKVWKHGTG